MPARRPQPFEDMSAEAILGLAAAWSGAVGTMLFILILADLLS